MSHTNLFQFFPIFLKVLQLFECRREDLYMTANIRSPIYQQEIYIISFSSIQIVSHIESIQDHVRPRLVQTSCDECLLLGQVVREELPKITLHASSHFITLHAIHGFHPHTQTCHPNPCLDDNELGTNEFCSSIGILNIPPVLKSIYAISDSIQYGRTRCFHFKMLYIFSYTFRCSAIYIQILYNAHVQRAIIHSTRILRCIHDSNIQMYFVYLNWI